MAKDVITRFKLETTGFDSKIKQAAKDLSAYSKTATQAKEGFNQFTKANVDAARALGTIATSTTNAKDRAKELVGAFNDAAKAYNALTKEQQQSDWAKALAGSLTQLQQRIKETKAEMQGLGDGMKGVSGGGGLFSGLGDKMSGALQVFAGNMLTKAAGAVAQLGSEIADMVKQGVELAKQGEGIRIAFERLGRGDILDGLREATHGTVTDLELMKDAVKFNDFKLPVEELGTMLAFAQQKAKDTGQSVDYMVDSIVTGLGRKSLMILDNLGLSATEVKEKMKETGDMTKAVGEIIREQMAKAGDYMETAADRAAQANVSLQNKMEELGRKFGPLEEASNSLWTSMKIGILDIIGGPLTDLLNKLTQAGRMANAYGLMGGNAKVGRMTANLAGASEGKRQSIYQQQQAKFWKYINPREQQLKDIRAWQSGERNEALQKRVGAITEKYGSLDATKIQAEVDAAKKMLSEYQQSAQQILKPIKQDIEPNIVGSSSGHGGKGGGKTGTEIDYAPDSIKAQQAEVQRLTKLWQGAGEALRDDYKKQLEEAQYTLDRMTGKEKFDPNKLRQIQGTVLQAPSMEIKNPFESMGKMKSEVVMELGAEQIKVDENTLHTLIKDAVQNSVNGMDLQFDSLGKQIAKGIDVPDSAWQSIIDQYNDLREQMGLEPITINIQTGNLEKLSNDAKVVKASFKDAASAVGNLGSALSGLDDPGAKIAGTVAQAIANIALAFSSADLKDGETGNVWYWIAATAAGLATMISTISSIHAATKYAEGGMVKGNSYSGDNILGVNNSTGELVGLNAGEIVLNRAQQGNLLSQGSGGGFNGQIVGRIEGENIVLVANRYFKRTGQGEILTWKN